MSAGPAISIWLLPDHLRLQRAIDRLGALHGAPRFEAHLTLLSGLDVALTSRACGAIATLSPRAEPIELPVLGCGESQEYFEAVFLRCAETAELRALRDRVRAVLGVGHTPAIGPHVSLLYARAPEATRRELARAHEAIAARLRFTSLALVVSGPRGWEPVEQWRVLARHRLGA